MITEQPELDRMQIDYCSPSQVDAEVNQNFRDSYDIWCQHIVDTVLLFEPEADRHRQQLLAGIMVSLMTGAYFQYLNDPDVFDLEEYLRNCQDMVTLYIDKCLP